MIEMDELDNARAVPAVGGRGPGGAAGGTG